MRDRGAGWIVNITSAIVDTDQLDSPQQARSSTYAPSKAALDRLTVSFATELRGTGHRGERARARARGRDRGRDRGDGPAAGVVRAGRDDGRRRASRSPRAIPAHENGLVVRSGPVPAGAGMRVVTVALVTGGGSGIGQATARLLAARGAQVVVADVNEAGARSRPRPRSACGRGAFAVDVADDASVEAMVAFAVERFGGLDWACNIAGIAPEPKPFVEHTYDDWQRTIDVNLSGVFFCMQHELRQMLAQGRGGAIVNMSSGAGVVPAPGQPQYTAAKHGVLGLTKQAAQEFAAAGIRVNAVLPGPDRDRSDAGLPRRDARRRREDAAPPPDEAHGDAARDRAGRRLAVLRRGELRQRRFARRRRRPHHAVSARARCSSLVDANRCELCRRLSAVSSRVAIATALALATALFYAISNVLELLEAEKVPDEYAMRPALLLRLIKQPRWLLGLLSDFGGYICHAAALGLATVVFVEPILATGILMSLFIGVAVRAPAGAAGPTGSRRACSRAGSRCSSTRCRRPAAARSRATREWLIAGPSAVARDRASAWRSGRATHGPAARRVPRGRGRHRVRRVGAADEGARPLPRRRDLRVGAALGAVRARGRRRSAA